MQKGSATLVLALSLLAGNSIAQVASNPYQKGPDPTLTGVQAAGPFAVSTQTISGSGFGGGTIYSPNTAGTYGIVVVCPGFTATQSSISQISQRLATHGFVVVTIDTNSVYDFPDSRATQMLAALKVATAVTTGPAAGKIDVNRQALAGWSMGGGGTLIAASKTPGLKATVSFAPYSTSNPFASIRMPSALLGGTDDTIAPPAQHATKFYNTIPATTPKLLGIIDGATHFFPATASQPASYTEVAWMKRFLDNDTRYGQFLNGDSRYATFQSNGPF